MTIQQFPTPRTRARARNRNRNRNRASSRIRCPLITEYKLSPLPRARARSHSRVQRMSHRMAFSFAPTQSFVPFLFSPLQRALPLSPASAGGPVPSISWRGATTPDRGIPAILPRPVAAGARHSRIARSPIPEYKFSPRARARNRNRAFSDDLKSHILNYNSPRAFRMAFPHHSNFEFRISNFRS